MSNPLAAFQREDAILQNDVIEKLETYAASGGNVKAACDALSESYIGRPDALRAIVDWIVQSLDGEQNLIDSFQHQLLTNADAAIPRIDAALATQSEASALISKTLASPTWANVLFKNAEEHQQSLFADRVFQEARLQEVGFTADLIGSAQDLMEAVVQQERVIFGTENPMESEVKRAIRKIAALTTSNESATFVVFQFISQLEHLSTDLFLKRGYQYVVQEIRKEVINCVTAIGGESERVAKQWIYRLLILADSSIYGQQIPEVFIDALMGILDVTPRIRLEKHIKIVTHLYGTLLGQPILTNIRGSLLELRADVRDDPIVKSLLIHALCHEEITDALLALLFNSGSNKSNVVQANLKKRECLCLLVAYSKTFLPLQHDEIVRRLSNKETLAELNLRVRKAKRDLTHVVRVCEELKHGTVVSKFKRKAIEMFASAIEDFITAKGILIWAEKSLRGGKDVRSLLVSAEKYLGFLEAIAFYHSCLRKAVLNVILTAYMREYSGLESANVEQLRTILMNSITGMTKFMAGSDIVYSMAERWLMEEETEEEHFSRFVVSLLRAISPPYEPQFLSCLTEFLRHERVLRAVLADDTASSLVKEFELTISAQAAP
ncbi:hypothetical protein BWQ96_07641 [Gracilariopsis chorda]|uniref:Negative elongation factor D n=1 Tax=Gracilariopsis chorda TaxID=448386 RepID=A0A2V3IKN4_9FLOR|nr:hypothetical protein BWQ96_07641 [Gracilariopsis chorda]|eukprot:PXF42637.1 hypothetical protein BWQ96_07641 [Gracilariopsis chorda]